MNLVEQIERDGLTLKRKATTHGGEYAGPCPWCSGSDRFRVWPEQDAEKGGRWWCRVCDKSGDGIDYLRERHNLSYQDACAAVGAPTLAPIGGRPGRSLRGEQTRKEKPRRPPPGEVAALWSALLPVDGGGEAALAWDHDPGRWLTSRNLDPDAVAAHDLARMIPDGVELPAWAGFQSGRRRWPTVGYRLACALYDAGGHLVSIQARYTRPGAQPENRSKTTNPTGYGVAGLVFANPAARAMLCGEIEGACTVVICEGLPDFLTCATTWPTAPVVGLVSGGWTVDHAKRIPDGSRVAIRTHNDDGGDKYAKTVQRTFAGRRVELRRLVATGER